MRWRRTRKNTELQNYRTAEPRTENREPRAEIAYCVVCIEQHCHVERSETSRCNSSHFIEMLPAVSMTRRVAVFHGDASRRQHDIDLRCVSSCHLVILSSCQPAVGEHTRNRLTEERPRWRGERRSLLGAVPGCAGDVSLRTTEPQNRRTENQELRTEDRGSRIAKNLSSCHLVILSSCYLAVVA
jgi:hypothetical protein